MQNKVKIINSTAIDELSKKAHSASRLRMNHNIHETLDDPVQRLYNAMQLNTYVKPHRHSGNDRWELFQVLCGSAAILIFEANKITEKIVISAAGPNYAVEIPSNAWHSIVCLQANTVLFEIKKGPYLPTSDKDFAAWAPDEETPGAVEFVQWMINAKVGDTATR